MTDSTTPDARPLQPGDPAGLGMYRILGRLGEGGQGTVFLGRRTEDDHAEQVAIKLLHAGLSADDPARARFVRELDVAKRVARFCTAQVLDADLAGDQPYIVSEYVPGPSLHRLVQAEGPRTGGALERLAISTLTALYAIHQAGIVHRDFKPQNVMMGPDGPRVIDFGVARALGATGETQNVGTPAYMAPEHFTGAAVGPAVDMFAWGTTMVFAATGRPAFGNDEMAAVMHRIITSDPDLGGLPSPLREVVAACLAKEPERRPTAREAQERLVGASDEALPDPAAFAQAPGPVPAQAPVQDAVPGPPPFAPTPLQAPPPATGPGHDVRGTTAPQTYGSHPHERKDRGRLVVPIVAAAAVAALLAGGAVWAATRAGDDGPGRAEAGSAGGQEAVQPQENLPGGDASHLPSDARNSRNPDKKPEGAGAPQRPGTPQGGQSGAPAGGGGGGTTGGGETGGGGGGTSQEPAQKYSAQQVCGSGYYVQRSMAVSGGRLYQLYSNGTTKNCAVMLKNKNVGRPTTIGVWIQAQGGSRVSDSGTYSWYAGPVYVKAPGVCVRVGSGSYTSSYANCG